MAEALVCWFVTTKYLHSVKSFNSYAAPKCYTTISDFKRGNVFFTRLIFMNKGVWRKQPQTWQAWLRSVSESVHGYWFDFCIYQAWSQYCWCAFFCTMSHFDLHSKNVGDYISNLISFHINDTIKGWYWQNSTNIYQILSINLPF